MTTYAILLPGDESRWADASADDRERVHDLHRQFASALAERGHTIAGGAELAPSREARVLRTDASGRHTVTTGPYAETVEQLTGFYLVESEDLEDLLDVCAVLGHREGAIELRATVGGAA